MSRHLRKRGPMIANLRLCGTESFSGELISMISLFSFASLLTRSIYTDIENYCSQFLVTLRKLIGLFCEKWFQFTNC